MRGRQVVTNKGVSQVFIEKAKDPARAWRDDMNKIRDDPLLAIKQAEKRQREKIMDNPIKIAQFKEELEKKRLAKEEKKVQTFSKVLHLELYIGNILGH